ncbi:hypothetical protein FOXG_21456 [Fusarium oxysporum f. sp. lycopersici 4287]|uniref:Uncharacterized protein n=1 Tax=Fusarium oxysporum f. sp. lycopersici (strain 4287 / CBS 123668 / FGSC 9935 / NRRL 34936) TaxID=426428 RepID=A0A0J9VYA4_FUSO4|nr:hypothetical protein FOXG_21456 [Fusarium oxysporum f. sp. lycopersici 4287]KAJ9413488.1 hypothetical protein QL093DRAFT_2478104 [Fusarium oxysporum]KNB15731.1 hypothetical protein FOXG_21456 [Fusarium oxysporum f. sp. lycopersici 4287]
MATEISLNILGCDGAGKKTLVGSLIYKCGLGLLRLKELERESINQFQQIVPFYEKKGYAQTFYAPPGLVTVQKSQTPDYVIWVVDGPDLSTWNSSAEKLRSLLLNGDIQPRKKLIIAVNKMSDSQVALLWIPFSSRRMKVRGLSVTMPTSRALRPSSRPRFCFGSTFIYTYLL